MAYNELKYRERFTTSVDKNLLKAFRDLAEEKRQPLSWLMDDALDSFLKQNNIIVERSKKNK